MDEYTDVTPLIEGEDISAPADTADETPVISETEENAEHIEGHTEAEDYEELMRSDLEELKREFPELADTESLTDIKNPLRYGALRDLGLSPTEAYLAARGKVSRADNRAHLLHSVPRHAASGGIMPHEELDRARELFRDMSDTEIQRLYKRVKG